MTLAENGQIAVDLAMSKQFDLILMDMQMPEMDGYDATVELRRRGLKIPIVALTANVLAEDRDKCLACGCDGYLSKPIEPERFLRTIATYLSGGRPQAIQPVEKENTMVSESKVVRSAYANMAKMQNILGEFIEDLPKRTAELQESLRQNKLDQVRRTAHQLRGCGGGYGFGVLSERATDVEQAVKDQQSLEQISQQVENLVEYMRRIEGYKRQAETVG